MKHSVYSSHVCGSPTKGGRRCSRRTAKGTLCWQHGMSVHGLRVKKSQIRGGGLGLFTTKTIKKDKLIDKYKGEKLNTDQLNRRYPGDQTAQYVVQVGDKNSYIDGRKTDSSYARYANAKQNNNAELRHTSTGVNLESKKKIKTNTEIITRYHNERTHKKRRYKM